jgi:hypothetical protein
LYDAAAYNWYGSTTFYLVSWYLKLGCGGGGGGSCDRVFCLLNDMRLDPGDTLLNESFRVSINIVYQLMIPSLMIKMEYQL